jgi:hypothetical protein
VYLDINTSHTLPTGIPDLLRFNGQVKYSSGMDHTLQQQLMAAYILVDNGASENLVSRGFLRRLKDDNAVIKRPCCGHMRV